jgi:hypothetical protein
VESGDNISNIKCLFNPKLPSSGLDEMRITKSIEEKEKEREREREREREKTPRESALTLNLQTMEAIDNDKREQPC